MLLTLTIGCTNPTANIQDDVEHFEKSYPDHIEKMKGQHREIQYAWSGDPLKRPLIFVHGSPGSWEGWAHFLMSEQLTSNFQIFSIDRPGYGGSGKGDTEKSLANQGDEVIALLSANKSGLPAILVGHSYGGPVIARAVMDHPDKVAGLVFVASSVSPELEHTKWYQYPASWWPIEYLIPTVFRVCNEEIRALKPELEVMLPLWKDIHVPVAIVQGSADDLVPKENADFIKAHLQPGILVSDQRVPGLNHFIPWKTPERIEVAIDKVDGAVQVIRQNTK